MVSMISILSGQYNHKLIGWVPFQIPNRHSEPARADEDKTRSVAERGSTWLVNQQLTSRLVNWYHACFQIDKRQHGFWFLQSTSYRETQTNPWQISGRRPNLKGTQYPCFFGIRLKDLLRRCFRMPRTPGLQKCALFWIRPATPERRSWLRLLARMTWAGCR